jgi:hypothetical protein
MNFYENYYIIHFLFVLLNIKFNFIILSSKTLNSLSFLVIIIKKIFEYFHSIFFFLKYQKNFYLNIITPNKYLIFKNKILFNYLIKSMSFK